MPADSTRWAVELWRPGRPPLTVECLEGPLEREHRCRAAYRSLALVLTVTPINDATSRMEVILRAEDEETAAYLSLRPIDAPASGPLILPEGRLGTEDLPLVGLHGSGTVIAAVGEAPGTDFRPPDPAPLGERGGPRYRHIHPSEPDILLAHFLRLPSARPEILLRTACERARRLREETRC